MVRTYVHTPLSPLLSSLLHTHTHTHTSLPFLAPTQMINNITVERNDNNTFLIIQWEPYLTPGGREVPTATYDIEYREVGSGSSVMSRRVYNTPGIIGGLTNAENYEVSPIN